MRTLTQQQFTNLTAKGGGWSHEATAPVTGYGREIEWHGEPANADCIGVFSASVESQRGNVVIRATSNLSFRLDDDPDDVDGILDVGCSDEPVELEGIRVIDEDGRELTSCELFALLPEPFLDATDEVQAYAAIWINSFRERQAQAQTEGELTC